MIIGNFSYDKTNGTYLGSIITLTIKHNSVVLSPIEKTGQKGPEYRVMQQWEGGNVEIGAAWRRSSAKGRDFLSVMIDDPALPSAISAAMFLAADETTATLVWTRQAARPAQSVAGAKGKARRARSQPEATAAP
jgi:uncharacterized protein (DUF736 family)